MAYADYVNSFYSNDVNMLKKRQNQSKKVRAVAVASGTAMAGLGLLPKNKMKISCIAGAVFFFLCALNTHNYIKNVDKKLNTEA